MERNVAELTGVYFQHFMNGFVAFGRIGLNFDLIDQLIGLYIAVVSEVETAIGALAFTVNQALQCIQSVKGGYPQPNI